jgi:hypothetical protein
MGVQVGFRSRNGNKAIFVTATLRLRPRPRYDQAGPALLQMPWRDRLSVHLIYNQVRFSGSRATVPVLTKPTSPAGAFTSSSPLSRSARSSQKLLGHSAKTRATRNHAPDCEARSIGDEAFLIGLFPLPAIGRLTLAALMAARRLRISPASSSVPCPGTTPEARSTAPPTRPPSTSPSSLPP